MDLKQRIGQLFFSTMSHKLYDTGLYRVVTPYFWQCKTDTLLSSYKRNLANNHLEIGVGTGFLIKESAPVSSGFRLTLMDLNEACLRKSARTLAKYKPNLYQQNILEPFEECTQKFDS